MRQAEDRAHRHGQRFPVNVYFLLARGTTDERRRGCPITAVALKSQDERQLRLLAFRIL